MKTLLYLLSGLILTLTGYAQNLPSKIEKRITLDEKSKLETVEYTVDNTGRPLSINLNAKINTGNLNIWIQDPNGKKVNNFQLQCSGSSNSNSNSNSNSDSNSNNGEETTSSSYTSTSSSSTGAKGVMEENVSNPLSGIWKIFIDPQEAKGSVDLKINN
jgi:hypothetical protein